MNHVLFFYLIDVVLVLADGSFKSKRKVAPTQEEMAMLEARRQCVKGNLTRGRLTLLKSILGASPIYNMSIFKVPRGVLKVMEAIHLPLHAKFPRLYALELDNDASVAVKLSALVDISFRRRARGGLEQHLMAEMQSMLDLISLSNSSDRWFCDLANDGIFRVKEVRNFIDDLFLPSHPDSTRWVKSIPIKINIFTWRARRDCLPTRANLVRRGVRLESPLCPIPKGGPRSRSGRLGFLRSASHPRLNLYWRVFFRLLGGRFGGSRIGPSLRRILLDRKVAPTQEGKVMVSILKVSFSNFQLPRKNQVGLVECIVRAVNSCHPHHLHLVLYESLMLGAWQGGLLLASSLDFDTMCVTKAEYKELGSYRCQRHFFH
nr:RNA-directed DNA polymerase, eukaryota [Tanacetum cinerariifolium]